MKAKKFFLAAAVLATALAFTYSGCSKDGSTENNIGGGESSSSAEQIAFDTVNIGKQTWLKHNLNVMPSSGNSWCWGEGKSSVVGGDIVTLTNEEIQANCDKYGRLYDWQAAMSGICPDGFHLPTSDDWNELLLYLDEEYDKDASLWCNDEECFYSGESTCACSKTSAKILKAQEGWIDCGPTGSSKKYPCDDPYGFSALPGGYFGEQMWFGTETSGEWWSATETENKNGAYSYHMSNVRSWAYLSPANKASRHSVRCVKHNPNPPIDPHKPSSSSAGDPTKLISIGRATVTDNNDCEPQELECPVTDPTIDCAAPARICKIIAENDALTYGGKRPCPGDVIYIAANSGDTLEFTVAKPYELPEEHLGYELTSCDYVTNKNLMLEFIEPPCDYREVKVKCK